MPTIRGRIIRIIDTTTVIINLGHKDGIGSESLFSILGSPESIEDPFSGEELGTVTIVKGKVRASAVFDRFTVASTQWSEPKSKLDSMFYSTVVGWEEHDEKLFVLDKDLKPWRARTKEPVKVGDEVEVEVSPAATEPSEEGTEFDKRDEEQPGATESRVDSEADGSRQ